MYRPSIAFVSTFDAICLSVDINCFNADISCYLKAKTIAYPPVVGKCRF